MQKFTALLGTLAVALTVAGAANAGYWEVTYDLGNSIVTTNSPAGALTDPMTGQWKFRYDVLSQAAAPTAAALLSGSQFIDLQQTATSITLTLTGDSFATLLPATGGTASTVAGATLQAFTVPDSSTTGFNHCYGPFCVIAGFPGSSIPAPLTPTGPGPFPFVVPNLQFASIAGVGNFTSATKTDVVGPSTNIQTIYRGVEISRVYHFGPVPALGSGPLLGLAAFLLIGGTSTLALRNRS